MSWCTWFCTLLCSSHWGCRDLSCLPCGCSHHQRLTSLPAQAVAPCLLTAKMTPTDQNHLPCLQAAADTTAALLQVLVGLTAASQPRHCTAPLQTAHHSAAPAPRLTCSRLRVGALPAGCAAPSMCAAAPKGTWWMTSSMFSVCAPCSTQWLALWRSVASGDL